MIVVDSSFLIALITPDRREAFVKTTLEASAGELHAPLLLPFEVVHVLSRKFQRGEISLSELNLAVSDLERQLIDFDTRPDAEGMIRVATLAASEKLSGYDAAYLDLALRLRAELGTLDGELAEAGRRCGIVVHHA